MLPDYRVNFSNKSVKLVNYNDELHDIPQIWKKTMGEGVKIGLLDTGLPDHADVKTKIKAYKNFTTDASVYDMDGHSTHCGGRMVGESEDPNVGIIGIAPKSELYIGKVMNDQGMGNDEWLAAGIKWCVQQGCHIINMSLGAPSNTDKLFPLTKKEILNAYNKNVFMFAAAGNEGIKSIGFPAKMNEVFCIGSIDINLKHSKFSNTGMEIDFVGLGEQVVSTYLNQSYASISGSSMACPAISAIAALILSNHIQDNCPTPLVNFWDMREHLIKLSTDLGGVKGWDEQYGWGNPVFGKPDMPFDPKNMGGIVQTIAARPWWKKILWWIK